MKTIYRIILFGYNMDGGPFSPLWIKSETDIYFKYKEDADIYCENHKDKYTRYEIEEIEVR